MQETSLRPAVEEISEWAAPCGIFQSRYSTGMFPLRFDGRLKRVLRLNKEFTKLDSIAKAIFQDACGRAAGVLKNNTEL
jgi:hypothetical protein